jgi:hypothetical protein
MDFFTEGKEITQEKGAVRSGDTCTQPGQQADQTRIARITHTNQRDLSTNAQVALRTLRN